MNRTQIIKKLKLFADGYVNWYGTTKSYKRREGLDIKTILKKRADQKIEMMEITLKSMYYSDFDLKNMQERVLAVLKSEVNEQIKKKNMVYIGRFA